MKEGICDKDKNARVVSYKHWTPGRDEAKSMLWEIIWLKWLLFCSFDLWRVIVGYHSDLNCTNCEQVQQRALCSNYNDEAHDRWLDKAGHITPKIERNYNEMKVTSITVGKWVSGRKILYKLMLLKRRRWKRSTAWLKKHEIVRFDMSTVKKCGAK